MALQRDRHKRLYGLHSWAGIVLGWFMFVVAWTGTAALFVEEIITFEDPSLRLAVPQIAPDIEPAVAAMHAELSEIGRIDYFIVDFPRPHTPFYRLRGGAVEQGAGLQRFERKLHPITGDDLVNRGEGAAHWMLEFHTNLMIPGNIGRAIVGLAGIVWGLAIATGLFIHGKLIREFFTLRLDRSQRLKWQDSHKVMGVLTLLFSIMIAFTGAFLGIIAILAPIIAVIAFKGDTESLIDAVVGKATEPAGVQAQMLTMEEVQAITHPRIEDTPYRVLITNYGDAAAQFDVLFFEDTQMATTAILPVSGVTGAPLPRPRLTDPQAANRVVNAMSPLHFGTYGGIALKWLYAVLGLFMCIISATGIMLWIERRRHSAEGRKSDAFYEALSRLNTGICLGFPFATVALLAFDALYFGAEAARLFWTGVAYFGFVAVAIAAAFAVREPYAATRRMLVAVAAMTLFAAIANLVRYGTPSLDTGGGRAALWVLVSLTALSGATWLASHALPSKRNVPQTTRKALQTTRLAPAD